MDQIVIRIRWDISKENVHLECSSKAVFLDTDVGNPFLVLAWSSYMTCAMTRCARLRIFSMVHQLFYVSSSGLNFATDFGEQRSFLGLSSMAAIVAVLDFDVAT
jgi:hypothetical protein